MSFIQTIKQKILQLDAGSFQNLCDTYLSKVGYPNIMSLGSEAGTRKTTPGTPDTWFYDIKGQYIFVEYTTQKTKLFPKIKSDIEKCLDVSKTGISHDKISEIIYCHTSSNITPKQDNQLKCMCTNVGIKLTIIGIDQLAEELYLYHHGITLDILGISTSTNQIQALDDFVKEYNLNRMAAPIDTQFMFREKEIENINSAFKKSNIVILTGPSGTGKTRLALHYAKNHSNVEPNNVYCVHSNALPIYEDLKNSIDCPGNYFIVIDDANQLSELQLFIRETITNPTKFNIKLLITVRDYALQKVINDIKGFSLYELVNVSVFTDEEIKELLISILGIKNADYQNRIIRIAEGNARIAMLAGKIACDSNRLDSINDVSQLYADYYNSALDENNILNDNTLCRVAGILAFLDSVHLEHLDIILSILQKYDINKDTFIESVNRLHQLEIVNVYHDKAVRFSEQCLANYLLKYVYYDKKLLSLSEMIKVFFKTRKERTVLSINTLLYIFRDSSLYEFVEKEIMKLWTELKQENLSTFFDFVKVFFRINPTETLLILQNKIQAENSIALNIEEIDAEKGKNFQSVNNDIIEIIGGFADADDLPTAIDLLFHYYSKRPDLYMQFYHAINIFFGINTNSNKHEYYTQIMLFKKFKEHLNDTNRDFIILLFLDIAKEFLKLKFTPSESGRKNSIIIYNIPLSLSEGVEEYRRLIWELILIVCETEKYKIKIKNILSDLDYKTDDINIPVLEFDLSYIIKILEYFPADELNNCILANKLLKVFNCCSNFSNSIFSNYLTTKEIEIYRLLKGDSLENIDWKKREEIKAEKIKQYIINSELNAFKRIIDFCSEIDIKDNHENYEITNGLSIAFNVVLSQKDFYVDSIKYYLEKNTPLNLQPHKIIGALFSLMSDEEIFELINSYEITHKNTWLYEYYHELPTQAITERHLNRLYDFLSDTSDAKITSSGFRDIDFLDKYASIDENVLYKGCEIILKKYEYSPFIAYLYFDLSFNCHHNNPESLISKFKKDLSLLKRIYIAMLTYDNHFDYNGNFLKEIYKHEHSIIDGYIDWLIHKKQSSYSDHTELNQCFFYTDDFLEIYDKVIERLISEVKFPSLNVPYYLKSILKVTKSKAHLDKQDIWIRHYINSYYSDMKKMEYLFSAIAKMEPSRKTIYLQLFLDKNPSFEDFKELPLTPISWEYSNSAVPLYTSWKDYLISLLPLFNGLKFLEHKNYVQECINSLQKQIEDTQVEEILKG